MNPITQMTLVILVARWYWHLLLITPRRALWHLLLVTNLLDVIKPRMLKGVMGANSQFGPQLQHALEEINATGIDLRQDSPQVLRGKHLEILLVLGVL